MINRVLIATVFVVAFVSMCHAAKLSLVSDTELQAFSQEISGESAKRHLEFISQQHRMRGSRGFHSAAQYIVEQLHDAGISGARIEQFPADGKKFYGTQKSRPPWNADFAELWEVALNDGGRQQRIKRIASWDAVPLSLAQDSESGEVTAQLVDVGDGLQEEDYRGDIKNKLVLTSSQPEVVVPLAVGRFGAAGIISYAQNQKSAWWGEDENLVRWGHLDTFSQWPSFAFMVSPRQASVFQQRLAAGEKILLHAKVSAGKREGYYEIVTAEIPGAHPEKSKEEIVFSCHLDHPHPGANDNASGCAAILEVARTFAKLIREKRIEPPERTLRFVWPPEIEGTIVYLNAKPEIVQRMKSVIHLDMVGGGPETKALFHITRGPASLPSFIYDVAAEVGRFVNQETYRFATTGASDYPLHAPEGGKEPLQAAFAPFSAGSDHVVYADSSFAIPGIYMNDWPDRYIHTNYDLPANIDPTKLKRAAFIAALSAFILSNAGPEDAEKLLEISRAAALQRTGDVLRRRTEFPPEEREALSRFHLRYEQQAFESMQNYFDVPVELRQKTERFSGILQNMLGVTPSQTASIPPEYAKVYQRNQELRGPMSAFGYDYFEDHYGKEKTKSIGLLTFRGLHAEGPTYAYEALNFIDGKRNIRQIRDALSAAYGPVPIELVLEYCKALESIGVIQ